MQNWYYPFIFLYSSLLFASDCQSVKPEHTYSPIVSKSFSIDYYKGYRILHRGLDQIILKSKNTVLPCESNLFQIETPIRKIVLTSTTQLPALELLSLEDSLLGFQGKKYIYSDHFIKNKIINISHPLVPEELLKIKPDLVMTYELNSQSNELISKFRKLKIPIVLNDDFLEKSSLARAEWLVYIACFYNKEESAQKIFNDILLKYNLIKNKLETIKKRRKVLVGDIQNGKWVTCGGESDLAKLINDAGGELLLSSKTSSTQRRSLEDLYLLPSVPDIWLTQNNWTNLSLIKTDSRYKNIKTSNIYNNHNRLSADGANDYWEMGMSRPDLLLEDYAAIFFPEIFIQHKLLWYKKL